MKVKATNAIAALLLICATADAKDNLRKKNQAKPAPMKGQDKARRQLQNMNLFLKGPPPKDPVLVIKTPTVSQSCLDACKSKGGEDNDCVTCCNPSEAPANPGDC